MAVTDNYLPCEAYTAAPDSEKYPGFKSWHDADTNSWYFAAVTNKGRVVLRSEAYTTEAARDNGIESVQRNRDLEERYAVVQDETDGQWYTILKAGNHQEIARSCGHADEAAALAAIAQSFSTYRERSAANRVVDEYLPCEAYTAAPDSEKYPGFKSWHDTDTNSWYFAAVTNKGRVVLRSEAYTTEAARDNGIESVMRNRDLEERYAVAQDESDGQWYTILKAGNHQEIARSCGHADEAAALAAIAQSFSAYRERSAANRVVDEYLPCEAYTAAPDSEKYPGFKSWHDADTNSWYFAAVTNKGRVVLRSEAYTTEAARDNGIESVMRNRDLEERYAVVQDEADGQWYTILKAGNRQEIARSCAYADHAAALAGVAAAMSTFQEKRAATIIEDYLPCEAYSGKEKSKHDDFTVFRDEATGLYYFAMVDKNGKTILRSEGYKAAESRDNGIESVIRNRDIEERWVREKDEDGHYMSLKAANHQEIARTCYFESEGALLGWWMPFAAAAFAVLAPAAVAAAPTAPAVPIAPVVAPEPKPAPVVVTTKPDPIVPPLTTYKEPAVAAAAEGSNWWKWLLPLLLLGLLFLLWRGCDGCNKTSETSAVSVAPPPVVPADTAKTVVALPPVPAPVCNCTAATDPVFRPGVGEPKSLHRLGTNPEFGNSHGLSPSAFYDKLSSRYKTNATDKAFLDRVFKAMGYAGFADAKPELFSAVEIAPGTVGNIGYSKAHKTLYARLDTEGQDLLAFHIKAANGCDLHFMKTCGNHFFACPK